MLSKILQIMMILKQIMIYKVTNSKNKTFQYCDSKKILFIGSKCCQLLSLTVSNCLSAILKSFLWKHYSYHTIICTEIVHADC